MTSDSDEHQKGRPALLTDEQIAEIEEWVGARQAVLPRKALATKLGVSLSTLKNYMRRILREHADSE